MKELEKQEATKIEIVAEQKKQATKIGTLRPKQNHTLIEINFKNKTIQKAELEDKTITFTQTTQIGGKILGSKKEGLNYAKKSKVLIKENHFYRSALNLKNLKKVISREFGIKDFSEFKIL